MNQEQANQILLDNPSSVEFLRRDDQFGSPYGVVVSIQTEDGMRTGWSRISSEDHRDPEIVFTKNDARRRAVERAFRDENPKVTARLLGATRAAPILAAITSTRKRAQKGLFIKV